jgi:hypothetical protein
MNCSFSIHYPARSIVTLLLLYVLIGKILNGLDPNKLIYFYIPWTTNFVNVGANHILAVPDTIYINKI